MDYEIIHQPEQKLFKTEVDGRTAFVQYRQIGRASCRERV